jgi:predicted nucleic-acid-binding protein
MALIAVDTNIVVRLLTRDDAAQFEGAARCFAESEVLIPTSVLLETVWVLESVYAFEGNKIGAALRGLLGLPRVHAADAEAFALALDWYEKGLDFADALHLATSHGAVEFRTFDRNLVKGALGLGSCPVMEPAGPPLL